MKFSRPLAANIEIKIPSNLLFTSKTDTEGNILYTNKNLQELSGYIKEELLDSPHSMLRHPDMPRVIFFLLWEELKKGKDVTLLVKNLTKAGEYYWVHNEFKIIKNDLTHHAAYIVTGKTASIKAITQIEKLYSKLLKIEKKENIAASLFYLEHYLQKQNITLQEYMHEILRPQTAIASLFNKIKSGLATAA